MQMHMQCRARMAVGRRAHVLPREAVLQMRVGSATKLVGPLSCCVAVVE